MRTLALVLTTSALFLSATRANAFECTQVNDAGVTQIWLSRCIPYAISCANDLLLGTELRETIARSFRAWNDVPCSDMSFVEVGYTTQLEEFDVRTPRSQRNTIGAIDTDAELEIFPDSRLLALTFTHFAVETGEILDADIMLNATRFQFTDTQVECADENTFDLENTLVHEIGHFIGFDHVNDPEATMFASAEACEFKKRDLAQDDTDAICTVYPAGAPDNTCKAPAGGYDSAGVDGEAFRTQCDRFVGGANTQTEAQCIQERMSTGGCSCDSSRSHNVSGFALLALLALFRRRSASGR